MRRENLGRFCEITTLCMSRQPILVLQCKLLVDIHHLLLSVYEAVYGVFHKRADGHGAYASRNRGNDARDFLHCFEIHVSAELSVLSVVYTHIDYHSALLHHIGRDETRLAYRYHQNVGLAGDFGQSYRVRVTYRHRGILVQKEFRGRKTYDVTSTHDHGTFAFYLHVRRLK